MIIHIHKFPDAQNVATVREMPDGSPAPEAPWEVITLQDLVAFMVPFHAVEDDGAPAYDPATEKLVDAGILIEPTRRVRNWQIVALTQEELDAIADTTEREAVKAMRDQIAVDIEDSKTDQAQAQTFISLTKAEREVAATTNAEILNSARRDKSAEQRYRSLARIARYLLKTL